MAGTNDRNLEKALAVILARSFELKPLVMKRGGVQTWQDYQ